MADDALRIGLVGCGGISRAHVSGYAAAPDAAVVTMAAPSEEARTNAEANTGATPYADWREMIDSKDLDAACRSAAEGITVALE